MDSMAIAVFSFNRGVFLEHCIKTIEKNAPELSITIYDDNSDDQFTCSILERLSKKYKVKKNIRPEEVEDKTGGLAGCMNMAMRDARDLGIEYILFIQDDMQLVRPITHDDLSYIDNYFDVISNTFQISTNFFREINVNTLPQEYYTNIKAAAYIRHKESEHGKSNFSDTGVFSVSRFYQLFQNFEVGEDVNSMRAISNGLTLGFSIYPFMCWLPYPLSYRGKKRTPKHLLFEHYGRSGFYPILQMQEEEVKNLFNRNPEELPIMERFLHSPSSPRQDVWSTGGGEYNFLAYDGNLAKLYKIVKNLKRKVSG